MNVNSWVLSLFGATDYEAYSENDHKMIADVVNTFYPGRAEYLKIDSLDHNAMKRPDIFAVNTGFPFNTQLFTVTKTWLDDKKNAQRGC